MADFYICIMHIKAGYRFIIAILAGLAGGTIGLLLQSDCTHAAVIGWDVFTLAMVLLAVREFMMVKKDTIRELCATEDESTWLLFGIVITACVGSLFILLFLFSGPEEAGFFMRIAGIFAVALSWFLLHVSFTFRYAHMYYGDKNERYSKSTQGLDFPGKEAPDYFDFAYFSFILGMTFQVSDVVITSPRIRKLALLHSLIAFVFNTVIVALTVSQLIRH